ncbi:hypothetical protein [Anaerovorax sp. IOR16]|uniref:hypothetical protein n=1 Tax=Anaerovorax sp. IOR16 TaxID=2773458 RepID=UPI0019CF8C1B|nr:hypothetical protein [Anaerovorax sp. IOR16]
MEKINNPDIVAALLAASVTSKVDYTAGKKDDSGNCDLIAHNSVEIFKSIFREINNLNHDLK